MIRAVVDTHGLVSGFLSPSGAPGRILDWLRAGTVVAVLDERILAEYAEVLARPAFHLAAADADIVLDSISSRAEWADVGPKDGLTLPDPDDAPFAECAHAADVPLVTGNQRHFPRTACRGVSVLTPAQFVVLAATL